MITLWSFIHCWRMSIEDSSFLYLTLISLIEFSTPFPISKNWYYNLCLPKTLKDSNQRCLFISLVAFPAQRGLKAFHSSTSRSQYLSYLESYDQEYEQLSQEADC